MIVVVSLEHHFYRTPDGCIWTQTAFPYSFWQRYLEVFEGVRILSRIEEVATPPPPNYLRVDGPGVTATAVPNYLGPWEYLRKIRAVHRAVRLGVGPEDAIIMRVGSQLANCLFPALNASSRPYGLEVVGDPWDVFAPGVVQHLFRPFFRRHFTRRLKKQCAQACAVAYVTERTLQQRYPVSQGNYQTSYSSVVLPKDAFKLISVGVADEDLTHEGNFIFPRDSASPENMSHLVMVGSLAQLYKGPDVAIDALAICVQDGLNVSLTIIGDGKFRPQLEKQVARLGLNERVTFRGQLPQGEAVRAVLDNSDLFIMPSQTEGLPRSMIEAMARGLPCIGSCVGGIPELLPPEDLVPPNNASALAAKIREIITNPQRLQLMSVRNLERSQDFHKDILQRRRLQFYRFVRERTEEWLKRRIAA